MEAVKILGPDIYGKCTVISVIKEKDNSSHY